MTIFIPVWAIWVGGIICIPLAIIVIIFAWTGFLLWWNLKDGIM